MPHKFRELEVWQRALGLVTDVYTLTRTFPKDELYGLTSPLRRAALSVPLNIAEGAGADSSAEFAHFLSYALRSLYETITALELAERLHYCERAALIPLLEEADQIGAMLFGLAQRLRGGNRRSIREIDDVYLAQHFSPKSSTDTEAGTEDTTQLSSFSATAATWSEVQAGDTLQPDNNLLTTAYRRLTTGYVLREARTDEAAVVARIVKMAFAEYDGHLHPPSGALGETTGKIAKKMEGGCAVLAVLDDEPVGCVIYQPNDDHVYLGRLAVLPEHRHNGLGAMLVAYVERQAIVLNTPTVRLGVRVALPHLYQWYEQQGYTLFEECFHPGFDEPTYLMLEKAVKHVPRRSTLSGG